MNKPIFALTLGATLLAASTQAQVTKNKTGYLLRVKYVKGSVLRFNSSNDVSGVKGTSESRLKFEIPVSMTVRDVENGLSTVQLNIGAAILRGQPVSPARSAVMKLDNRNKAQQVNAPSLSTTLPLQPVKVGQSWVAKAPVALGAGQASSMEATYTFGGLTTLGGRPVAIVRFTIKGAAQGSGVEYLLVSDGTLYGSDFKIQLNADEAKGLLVHSVLKRK